MDTNRTSFDRPIPVAELMELSELCDHLNVESHSVLKQQIETLDQILLKDSSRPGSPGKTQPKEHPAASQYRKFRQKLLDHLKIESERVFPLIKRLEQETDPSISGSRQLQSLLGQMRREHALMDETFAELEVLVWENTAEDSLPEALTTAMARLDNHLQERIFCENRILYRRAKSYQQSS